MLELSAKIIDARRRMVYIVRATENQGVCVFGHKRFQQLNTFVGNNPVSDGRKTLILCRY